MAERGWTFLTNHAHVLVCLTRHPRARVWEVAQQVGISERMVQLVLKDLEEAGYLVRRRVGRRNEYEVVDGPLRHPLEREHQVQELLGVLTAESADQPGVDGDSNGQRRPSSVRASPTVTTEPVTSTPAAP